jgi:hypothetical protein
MDQKILKIREVTTCTSMSMATTLTNENTTPLNLKKFALMGI